MKTGLLPTPHVWGVNWRSIDPSVNIILIIDWNNSAWMSQTAIGQTKCSWKGRGCTYQTVPKKKHAHPAVDASFVWPPREWIAGFPRLTMHIGLNCLCCKVLHYKWSDPPKIRHIISRTVVRCGENESSETIFSSWLLIGGSPFGRQRDLIKTTAWSSISLHDPKSRLQLSS